MNGRNEFIKNYIGMLIKPSETVKDIDIREQNILDSLMLVCLSALIFVLGIFIAGGTVYNIFFEQYSTFFLEQITSASLYGFNISRYDYFFVFIGEFIFIVKSWLFFSITFYIIMRVFGEKESLKDTFNRFAWSIYPYAIALFGISLVCLILKFIIPLLFHVVFFMGLLVVFIVLVPLNLQRFYASETRKEETFTFKVTLSYYLTLFVAIIIWSINHYHWLVLVFF